MKAKVPNPNLPIYIVDDEKQTLNAYKYLFLTEGFNNVELCSDSREVLPTLEKTGVSIILLDLMMPHITGEELIPDLHNKYPDIPIVVITGIDKVETAVNCLKSGAYDYLVKPVNEIRLISTVKRALEYRDLQSGLRKISKGFDSDKLKNPDVFANIITANPKMRRLFKFIEAIGASKQPVLITGETGVGKGLMAEAIHRVSGRKGDFVAVNISGLDEQIFSDTIFGHVKGAYTGADSLRGGLAKKAEGGTLFLDEIGDLSKPSQLKLLRFIQEGEFYPIGSDKLLKSDCRIIIATNADLKKQCAEGTFRQDLYYRLSTHQIEVPPLRARKSDTLLLFRHFLEMSFQELNKALPQYEDEVTNFLQDYNFPGNVRELMAIVHNAAATCESGKLENRIILDYLGLDNTNSPHSKMLEIEDLHTIFSRLEELPAVHEMTRGLVQEAVKRCGGNHSRAAKMLNISRPTLLKYFND